MASLDSFRCPPYEFLGTHRLNVLKRESIDPRWVCVDTHLSLEGPEVCLCIFIISLFIGLHEKQEEMGIVIGLTKGTKFTNLSLNRRPGLICVVFLFVDICYILFLYLQICRVIETP